MKIFFPVLFCMIAFSSYAQQDRIHLIIRGDDMGYTHSGNQALIKCYQQGIETSIEVIVASPWFPEAVKLLQQNPSVDVGVHLALTSEWENIKWRPLTDCASLKDSSGYFFPMVYPNKNYPRKSISENPWKIADIEKEFRAQIELALKKIPRISHISSHMDCTSISEDVKNLTKKLAKEYKINIDPEDYGVISVGYEGPNKTAADKVQSTLAMLKKLQPGKSYIFLDHPGFDNDELRAVFHIGYEDVAADRQGVTDLFTSPVIKSYIKEKGILLISYKDLLQQKK